MSEKKIVVPTGMIEAAHVAWQMHPIRGYDPDDAINKALEAAIRWLSENPIVPTRKQWDEIGASPEVYGHVYSNSDEAEIELCVAWQRRMFLAPEPEIPEAVKDLLEFWIDIGNAETSSDTNRRILEAYRRGQKNPK